MAAALPVIESPADYGEESDRIKSFLSEAKQTAATLGARGIEEEDGDDDAEDAALDLYLGEVLDLNDGNRRTGFKYKDAMVSRPPGSPDGSS